MPVLAAGVLAFAQADSTTQGPRQTVSRMSSETDHNPVEVAVAINPTDPDNVLAVSYQQGLPQGPRVSDFIYVSRDGGRTWTSTPAANLEGRTQGDDGLVFDETGVAYRSNISFVGIREPRPQRALSGIFVSRSVDGGGTWDAPALVVDHLNSVIPFEDKPWLAATRTATGESHVYVAWTRFDEYGSKAPECRSHIMFSRSIDGGRTFAVPISVSDAPGDCQDSDNTDEGAVPSVGIDREVYLAWAGPAGLMFDVSHDQGFTFGQDIKITDLPGGWDFEVPGVDRTNGMPVTGVDRSAGPYRGSIYINWIDARNGDPDVFVAASRDGGRTWSPPVRANDDAVGNGAAQFMTWMAVDAADGSINLVFMDRRGLTGTQTGVTVARSTDGGRSFRNYRVNVAPFETNATVAFGDYIGIAAYRGRVIAAFPQFVNASTVVLSAARFDF
jgi:hypothetical protein